MSSTSFFFSSKLASRLAATLLLAVTFSLPASATTVTITNQTGNLVTTFTDGTSGWFNASSTELGFYAKDSGAKQAVAWQSLTTTGAGNSGTSRSLQVGDEFRLTARITRPYGQVGFSLNNSGATGSSWANRTNNSRLFVEVNGHNNSWYVGGLSNSATSTLNYTPSQDTYRDYEFRVFITSQTTGYVELWVNGGYHSTAYNLTFGGTAGENLNGFSMFGSDMWDGTSSDDGYFKNTSVRDNGFVNLGYNLANGSTFNPGVVDDGLSANSTTTTIANAVNIGGDSGSTVILDDANTYTGATTVNATATARAAQNNAFGTAGTVTVTTGGRIQMSNGITVSRALVLNGDGISASGSLQNVSGDNTWSGNITNNSGARINSDTGTFTISGNISNAASQTLYVGGSGNTVVNGTIAGSHTTGNGALYKDGSGTLTLTNNNSGLTGLVRLLGGSVSITNVNSLGTGNLELGGNAVQARLLVNSNNSRSQNIIITDGTTNSVIEVASGQTFTNTGNLSGGGINTTKFGKAGAGTLILAGTGSTFGGQIQVGDGTLIIGSNNGLSTNITTTDRGVDLGLNIGDTSTGNNVALLASNNVTISNSIYVAPNTSNGKRTIGLSGSGTSTFNNEIYLDGNLTVDAGNSGSVNISGVIATNNLGAGGGIIITNGTVVLSGANTYNGGSTVSGGSTLKIGAGGGSGALGGGNVTNNGSLVFDRTGTVAWGNNISGTGGLTKTNTGILSLSGANTYSGTTSVNQGTLKLERISSGVGAAAITGSTIAVNSGGTLLLGAANQIGDSTGITMSGGTLSMGNFGDSVGRLAVTAGSVFDFGNGVGQTSTFTFTDFDTAGYGGVAGLTFQNVNIGSKIVFNVNYSGNSTFNSFTDKISYSSGSLQNQISFSGGTTTLTVAAIPEPKLYIAAGALAFLIGLAEFRRRKKVVSSKA